jgi:hypothetical protein
LNWQRFFAEKWPIELVTINAVPALSNCFMPWYIDAKGDEVAYDHHEAHPMSVKDVPRAMRLLNDERRADIYEKVESLEKADGVVRFDVPTYSLPAGQYFVLDRNHRLSALTLHPVPFEVTFWSVAGPLDPDCLLDLIHWTPPRKQTDG